MTTSILVPVVVTVTCSRCKGAGEVHTQEIEPDTGHASVEACWSCGGEGFFRE